MKRLDQGHSAQKWQTQTALAQILGLQIWYHLLSPLPGNICWASLMRALEKQQGPHFLQLPTEDLPLFLLLAT